LGITPPAIKSVLGSLFLAHSRRFVQNESHTRIDHFCSSEVTHTKNTICHRARKNGERFIHAEGVRLAVPSSAPPGALA
jgi:hypothetical protein